MWTEGKVPGARAATAVSLFTLTHFAKQLNSFFFHVYSTGAVWTTVITHLIVFSRTFGVVRLRNETGTCCSRARAGVCVDNKMSYQRDSEQKARRGQKRMASPHSGAAVETAGEGLGRKRSRNSTAVQPTTEQSSEEEEMEEESESLGEYELSQLESQVMREDGREKPVLSQVSCHQCECVYI